MSYCSGRRRGKGSLSDSLNIDVIPCRGFQTDRKLFLGNLVENQGSERLGRLYYLNRSPKIFGDHQLEPGWCQHVGSPVDQTFSNLAGVQLRLTTSVTTENRNRCGDMTFDLKIESSTSLNQLSIDSVNLLESAEASTSNDVSKVDFAVRGPGSVKKEWPLATRVIRQSNWLQQYQRIGIGIF